MISRRIFLKGAMTTMAATLLVGCNDSSSGSSANGGGVQEDFKLAVLPDTQKYSENSPERYYAQTEWIRDNWEEEKIPFTIHLGDIVENHDARDEWVYASQAMSYLEESNDTPYSILCGNHDLKVRSSTDTDRNPNEEHFVEFFPESRQWSVPTCRGIDATGFNSYHIFTAPNGQEFLVLAIDWRPSDQTLNWAQSVLDEHPDLPAILSTHQLLNIAGDNESPLVTDLGIRLWVDFINKNDQIFLTLNGHHHGASSLVAKNAYGRDVLMVVVDYQSMFWGGNGLMRTVGFDYTNKQLVMRSFSPWVMNIPEDERGPHDQLNLMDGVNHFEFPMNFAERFTHFNDEDRLIPPAGIIENTEAYWVLDSDHAVATDGGSGKTRLMFPDLSGKGNNMEVRSLSGSIMADNYYFDLTEDSPGQGNAAGSMFFKGDKRDNSGVYLRSAGMSLSAADWNEGYTVEAFVKLPHGWNFDQSGWGGFLCHNVTQTQAAEHHGLTHNGDAAAVVMAISTLREVQWEVLSMADNTGTAWSWDLGTGDWHHIAIVNHGEKTEMFVDSQLVMRLPGSDMTGLATVPGFDWLIGASSWAGEEGNPLLGCVSEMRVVSRPLDQDKWLTA